MCYACQDLAEDLRTAALDDAYRLGRVEMPYHRNNNGLRKQVAPDDFGQGLEPWGRYVSPDEGDQHMPVLQKGWERGTVGFDNPLYLPHEYGDWKRNLSQAHGGLTGRELSQALLDKGHDGIVTHDKYGIGEIVDIRPKDQRGHQVLQTAAWGGTTHEPSSSWKPTDTQFIARGMDVHLPDGDHDLFHAINEHRATPEHMKRLIGQYPGVGVWWGTYNHPDHPSQNAYGSFEDFADHAGMNEESVAKYHDSGEYHERVNDDGGPGPNQIFASTPVVMVGKRPMRGNQPWDPEIHNEPDSLMGNSYLDDDEPIDLHEVHYHSGRDWVKVPMQGHQVQA